MAKTQLISGPAGNLEIMLTEPNRAPRAIAIICHPHPLHGGTMHNKVVTTAAKAFLDCGAIVVRFNYRGVENSEGEFDNAVGECDDCRAIINWALKRYPNLPLWLAGFSFGAYVATRVAHDYSLAVLCVGIAPAIKHYSFSELTNLDCPWLIVQGDEDEVAPCQPVQQWWRLGNKTDAQQLIILPGAGHFFHGRLIELREIISDWVENHT